jgi:hypothetical protein
MKSYYRVLVTLVAMSLLCLSAGAQGPADLSTATPEAAASAPAPASDPVPNPVPQLGGTNRSDYEGLF